MIINLLALKIIGIIVLLCFLIGRIRAGVDFNIKDGRITLSLKVCGISIQVIPKKKSDKSGRKKPEKETDKTEEKNEEKPEKKKKKPFFKIDVYDIKEMLSKVVKGLRVFKNGFNCERLLLHITCSSWDPYITAKTFSYINAFLSVFAPVFENRNRCRDCDIRTEIDFNETWPKIDAGFCITFRIGALFGMLNTALFGIIGVFIKIVFRFLKMKLFDPEEYDFRMNQQENPIAFFKRVIKEAKANAPEPAEETGAAPEQTESDTGAVRAEQSASESTADEITDESGTE